MTVKRSFRSRHKIYRAPVRRKKADGELTPLQRRRMVQLVVAGGVFVFLAVIKLLAPQSIHQTASAIREALGQDADFRAAFSAVGEAIAGEKPVDESIEEAYTAVFAPARYQAERTAAVMKNAEGVTLPADLLTAKIDSRTGEENPREKQESEAVLQTLEAQPFVYFNSATPANVTYEQKALGFDYTTPTEGTLTSCFGYREHPVYGEERFHYGLDIANVRGTEITAFAAGTVKATGESSSLGKYLMIAHDNHITTLYAHCDEVTVSAGETVSVGQKVAEMGRSGETTGTHLHFEVMNGSTYLNPIYYVEVY